MEKVCAGHSFLFASFAFSDWQFVARERVIAGFFPYRYGAGVDLGAGSGEWTLPVCPEPSAHLESRVWCGREDRGFPYLAIQSGYAYAACQLPTPNLVYYEYQILSTRNFPWQSEEFHSWPGYNPVI